MTNGTMDTGIGCLNFINSNLININSSFTLAPATIKTHQPLPCWKQSRDWQKGTLMTGPWFDKAMIMLLILI